MKDRSYTVGTDEHGVLQTLGDCAAIVVSRSTKERVVYRDTFDWRLHRADLSFTTRGSGKGTRGRLIPRDGPPVDTRLEGVPRFASDLPAGRLKDLLLPITGPRRFLAMGQAEWTETLVSVLDDDQKTVLRVALRSGLGFPSGSSGRGSGVRLPFRIMVRPLKGYRKEAKKFTKVLVKACEARLCESSEAEDALVGVGNPPGGYSSRLWVSLDQGMEAGESLTRIHRALLDVVTANREGVIRDWDPEFLHDFRVACRRARTGLTQFHGIFPESISKSAAREFKWLGGLTGPKRDLDVYLLRIPGFRASLTQPADDDLEPLVNLLESKQEAAQRRLVRGLKSTRFATFTEDWRSYLHGTASERAYGEHAMAPVGVVVTSSIRGALRRVLEVGLEIQPDTDPEAIHRLRILCKKLRYLITLFRSLFPPEDLAPVVTELKQLQEHLGEFNDLHVQQVALRTSAVELMEMGVGPPSTLLAMGQLLGRLEGEQARHREAFQSRFGRFARKRNRKRFEALFGTGEDRQ